MIAIALSDSSMFGGHLRWPEIAWYRESFSRTVVLTCSGTGHDAMN